MHVIIWEIFIYGFTNMKSLVPFISKVTEKAVCFQLLDHFKLNGLYEKYQSAYTEWRSCETALVSAQNVITIAMAQQAVTFIILLDMSGAFDTVNNTFWLNDCMSMLALLNLHWIWQYHTSQMGDKLSKLKVCYPMRYLWNVVSVSGSLYFLIYTLRRHGLNYHF